MQKKLTLSLVAILMAQPSFADDFGAIPTVKVPDAVEVKAAPVQSTAQQGSTDDLRANPQTGDGMRSVPTATMPPVNRNSSSSDPFSSFKVKQDRNDGRPETLYGNATQEQTQRYSQVEMTEQQKARAREKAFQSQMETMFPMTDEQIRRLNGKVENVNKAYRQSTNPVPKYLSASATMNFGINTDMPVVMLGANSIYETNLIFTDRTGAAWEISAYNVANSAEFKAYYPENIKGNQLSLITTAPYGVTSLTVNLKGAPSPLVLQLVTGQPVANSLFEVKVNDKGPNAPVGTKFLDSRVKFDNNADFEELASGVVPKGLKSLGISGNNVSSNTFAWASRDGQFVYVRSPMDINAPMPIEGSTIGGTNDKVYRLKRTNFISFAYQGRDITAKISGMPMLSAAK